MTIKIEIDPRDEYSIIAAMQTVNSLVTTHSLLFEDSKFNSEELAQAMQGGEEQPEEFEVQRNEPDEGDGSDANRENGRPNRPGISQDPSQFEEIDRRYMEEKRKEAERRRRQQEAEAAQQAPQQEGIEPLSGLSDEQKTQLLEQLLMQRQRQAAGQQKKVISTSPEGRRAAEQGAGAAKGMGSVLEGATEIWA